MLVELLEAYGSEPDDAQLERVSKQATLQGNTAPAHAAHCAICQSRLQSLREQDAVLAAVSDKMDEDQEDETPEDTEKLNDLTERMMTRLRADVNRDVIPLPSGRLNEKRPQPHTKRHVQWASASGFIILAASLAFLLFTSRGQEKPFTRARLPLNRQASSPTSVVPQPSTERPNAGTRVGTAPSSSQKGPEPKPEVQREPAARIAGAEPANADRGSAVSALDAELTRGTNARAARLRRQLEQSLVRYQTAVNNEDTAAVRSIYPSQPDDSLRVLLEAVGSGRHLVLLLESAREITDSEVEAVVRSGWVTGTETSQPAAFNYRMRRLPDGWLIVHVFKRP